MSVIEDHQVLGAATAVGTTGAVATTLAGFLSKNAVITAIVLALVVTAVIVTVTVYRRRKRSN